MPGLLELKEERWGLDLWVRAGKAGIQHSSSWKPAPVLPTLPPLPAVFFCPVTGSWEPDP